MKRQKFDIGDLVEYDCGRDKFQGLVLDKKTINPVYNTDRKFHIDEYHCKVLIFNDLKEDNETRWIRAKWLKLLSQAEE